RTSNRGGIGRNWPRSICVDAHSGILQIQASIHSLRHSWRGHPPPATCTLLRFANSRLCNASMTSAFHSFVGRPALRRYFLGVLVWRRLYQQPSEASPSFFGFGVERIEIRSRGLNSFPRSPYYDFNRIFAKSLKTRPHRWRGMSSCFFSIKKRQNPD